MKRMPAFILAMFLISALVAGPGAQPAAAAVLLVDDNNFECPTATFMSIQAAIAAASNGDTIKVCAGTYIEDLFLNKSLLLLGAQSGVDARGRIGAESNLIPLMATRTLELRTGSASSTIDGFTFLFGNRAIESTTGNLDGLQILNNRILQFTNSGIFLNDNGINITIDQNDIDGGSKVGGGDLVHLDTDNFDGLFFTNNRVVNGATATGFFVDGNHNVGISSPGARTPLFKGNLIDRNQTGVNLGSRAWDGGTIEENTFSNNSFDGVQGGMQRSLINNNIFDNNGRNGLTLTSFGSLANDRGARDNSFVRNCFTNNGRTQAGAGIFFSASQAAGSISTNQAVLNNITGNAMGARYLGPETINGQSNWWGASNGPGAPNGPGSGDGVDGTGIDFTPWLTAPMGGTPCSVGPAATLTLDPPAATNTVGSQHCVTATVTDAMSRPVPGVAVVFTVTGANPGNGSVTTNGSGQAQFCYQGLVAGPDAITAFADTNGSGMLDPGEPTGAATKTWTAATPVSLVLTPPTATNPVRAQHCVTATVRDAFGNPTPNIIVRFTVTGPGATSGSATTNAAGQATFCYTSNVPGADTITAFADSNSNGTLDPGEPEGAANKTWTAAVPATLVLTPPTATNTVGAQHCVTATVKDAFGNPTPGIIVRFTVTGPGATTGSATTNANGQATFCYTSMTAGSDNITAYADTNGNGTQDPGEPSGSATKTWTKPAEDCDDDKDHHDRDHHDDDDFDHDGKRNDVDNDDDNDGRHDDEDNDDDNDGHRDDEDNDHDNDCIDNDFDSDSHHEDEHSHHDSVESGHDNEYEMSAPSGTLLLIATAEAEGAATNLLAQPLRVEIYDPLGRLVASSPPTIGRVVAVAVPTLPGNYKVKVKNTGPGTIQYQTLQILRSNW